MLSTSGMVDTLLDGSVDDDNRVQKLTAIFFGLYLLMATQDIAVDGWYGIYRSTPPRHCVKSQANPDESRAAPSAFAWVGSKLLR